MKVTEERNKLNERLDSRDIHNMFYEDSRQKKYESKINKPKRGGFSKTRRVRLPSDIMSKDDRKQYSLNGKVETYNMNNIMKWSELKTKDISFQKKMIEHWKDSYTIKEISKGMGISEIQYYRIAAKIGVEKRSYRKHIKNTFKAKNKQENEQIAIAVEEMIEVEDDHVNDDNEEETKEMATTQVSQVEVEKEDDFIVEKQVKIIENEKDIFEINFNYEIDGVFDGSQLAKMFEKLKVILSDDNQKYYFELKVSNKK